MTLSIKTIRISRNTSIVVKCVFFFLVCYIKHTHTQMAPRELILGISKGRMEKLKGGSYGHTVPVKLRVAGGEIIGGMLSVAGSQHGGMLGAAGVTGAGKDWAKISKSVAGVASPLSMLAGPEMAPIAAGLAAYAGSGKKRRKATARKVKKSTGVASEIAKILLDTQGYTKEGEAIAQVGRVVAGSGKKARKAKNTIGDLSQIAALLGQSSGYMSPQQAAATQAIGSLIQGSGPTDLTGDVFYPPEAILPPRPRNARPRVAVGGGAPVTKKRFAVQ